ARSITSIGRGCPRAATCPTTSPASKCGTGCRSPTDPSTSSYASTSRSPMNRLSSRHENLAHDLGTSSAFDRFMIHLKRAYDPPTKNDGYRVLVDRLWPRGVPKRSAHIDAWLKDVAPSDALRRWFGHEPSRFAEFRARYKRELHAEPAQTALTEL